MFITRKSHDMHTYGSSTTVAVTKQVNADVHTSKPYELQLSGQWQSARELGASLRRSGYRHLIGDTVGEDYSLTCICAVCTESTRSTVEENKNELKSVHACICVAYHWSRGSTEISSRSGGKSGGSVSTGTTVDATSYRRIISQRTIIIKDVVVIKLPLPYIAPQWG